MIVCHHKNKAKAFKTKVITSNILGQNLTSYNYSFLSIIYFKGCKRDKSLLLEPPNKLTI